MFSAAQSSQISQLFKSLGDPFRVQLLLALAHQEACVCHLERLLGKRQAYISQHLMSLREVGLLTARREGKYIYYKLKDRSLLKLVQRAAEVAGVPNHRNELSTRSRLKNCECPNCGPEKLVSIG